MLAGTITDIPVPARRALVIAGSAGALGTFHCPLTINLTNHGLSSCLSGCLLCRELRDDRRPDRFPERVIFWPSRRPRAMLPQFGAELDNLAD